MMNKLHQLFRDNAAKERKPLNLVRAEGASEATLYVYDVIDSYWGVSAQGVAQAIAGLDANTTLHVRINSPGGDVFEARAIKSLLDEFAGKVVSHVDGLAASAATTIALAGDEVVMAEGAYWMIHNAWTIALGNKSDLIEMASLLEKMDGTIAQDYATKTGKPIADMASLMDAETWMTAQEAKDSGFIDSIAGDSGESKSKNSAAWNLAAYSKAPKALTEPPAPEPDLSAAHANNQRRLRLLRIA